MIARDISDKLQSWAKRAKRKPLLLRGARQVGKTYIARELGRRFPVFIEINFQEHQEFSSFFKNKDFDIENILRQISAYFGKQIKDGEALLYLDEIQACPEALESLRFFYEKRPNLHVLASGSLLEFTLKDLPTFGVGRIENLFMYPVNFFEYLTAVGQASLKNEIMLAGATSTFPEILHNLALKHFKNYVLIGGLPEIVSEFCETGDLNRTASMLENLIINYEDDFRKYAARIPADRLREVWRSSALQAGRKFVHKHAYIDAESRPVQQALNCLVMAGIVHKVFHSNGNGLPLGAEVDLKKFKTIPSDLGLYWKLTGLPITELILSDPANLINKGAWSEVLCGLELLKYHDAGVRGDLYYWHREAKSSNAEVDYLISVGSEIVPLEVKSDKSGALKSLHLFMKAKKSALGIKVSTENFNYSDKILTIPCYAVSQIGRVASQILANQQNAAE